MGNTHCGSIVVIAIPNAHTQDDATDSLSLRFFYGKNYAAGVCMCILYNRTVHIRKALNVRKCKPLVGRSLPASAAHMLLVQRIHS